jgi:hypothetical protein
MSLRRVRVGRPREIQSSHFELLPTFVADFPDAEEAVRTNRAALKRRAPGFPLL